MEQKILKFICENNLIPENKTIICAVSGGVDSICLLHILHNLNYSLVLAHVNHHKRKESDEEAKAMKALANHLKLPFELFDYYADHTENFQAKAHDARYSFFETLALKYNTSLIATAHHLDDQAETILMRILSGSNLYGYGGISIKKEENGFHYIRPLLCASKKELYDYALKHQLTYFEDSSNASDDYLRNRIRHHILPLFQAENENYLNKFQEFSVMLKQSFDFIRKQSINYLDKLNNNIDVSSFNTLDEALQLDILCLLLERYNLEKNNMVIHNCLGLIRKSKNKKIHLKQEYTFCIEYGQALIHISEPTRHLYK